MDPFHNPAAFFQRIQELLATRRSFAVATVTGVKGSTPREAGAKMIIHPDGTSEGTVGGGAFEGVVVSAAQAAITERTPRLVEHALTEETGAMCGGTMAAFVEPYATGPTLIMIGCGHVGRAILRQFRALGFYTVAVEDHAHGDIVDADQVVPTMEPSQLGDLPFGNDCFVIVATRGHERDSELACFAVTQQLAYLGIIGSKKKAAFVRGQVQAAAPSAEAMAKVHTPIGLPIGSQTPEEIAVSVAAEIIAIRAGITFPPT